MMQAKLRLGHQQERVLSCNSLQLKVRPKDNRLCRRAFPHTALTSCQQLHKGSPTAETNRASSPKVESMADQLRRQPDL
jgi:hypothetical protein